MCFRVKCKVLIIGFGKIGKIKASIWKKYGCDVSVYDINHNRVNAARLEGYKCVLNLQTDLDFSYIDICTPTLFHIYYLRELLLNSQAQLLVEKPLVSNIRDFTLLKECIEESSENAERIIFSEQYYYSKALAYLKNLIENENLISVQIVMNKNRISDNQKGRFIDNELEAFGIEIPHMLAILDFFKVDWKQFKPEKEISLYLSNDAINSGCRVLGRVTEVEINLESFLGSYRYNQSGVIFKNSQIERYLIIKTDKTEYRVVFDPVKAFPRYFTVVEYNGVKRIFDDNLLENMIISILSNMKKEKLSVHNGLEISKKLIELRSQAAMKEF